MNFFLVQMVQCIFYYFINNPAGVNQVIFVLGNMCSLPERSLSVRQTLKLIGEKHATISQIL